MHLLGLWIFSIYFKNCYAQLIHVLWNRIINHIKCMCTLSFWICCVNPFNWKDATSIRILHVSSTTFGRIKIWYSFSKLWKSTLTSKINYNRNMVFFHIWLILCVNPISEKKSFARLFLLKVNIFRAIKRHTRIRISHIFAGYLLQISFNSAKY